MRKASLNIDTTSILYRFNDDVRVSYDPAQIPQIGDVKRLMHLIRSGGKVYADNFALSVAN